VSTERKVDSIKHVQCAQYRVLGPKSQMLRVILLTHR